MYCGNCGTQFEGKYCPQCGTPAFTEENTVTMAFDPGNYELKAPITDQPAEKKRKGKLILFVGIAVALLAIICAGFLLRDLLPNVRADNTYIYLGRGKYQMLKKLKGDQSIQFGSTRSDLISEQLLAFSSDGRYIYFYTKVDESDFTGTLCRGEYGKFSKDASKNEKHIETIASGVRIGFRLLDNGGVVYQNQSGKLYCYNGKDAVQIARDVNGYITDGANWLYYTKGDYGDTTLYGVDLNDLENSIKLDKNVSYICGQGNNCVYYIKENRTGDYSQNLYTVSMDQDAELLGSNAEILNIDLDGSISYLRKSGSVSPYGFVEDSMATQDAGITEPMMEDYEVPFYTIDMIRESNPKESDYQGKELYTSCTQPLYWYGQGSGCSMEDAMKRTWNGNNDAIHTSTQSFIDRFGETADESGFILVTEEVKSALKDINQYGSTASDTTWLDLCYVREQNGVTIDYDAYDADYEIYYAASDRIRLRDELRNPMNDIPLYTLELYTNGETQIIAENVMFHEAYGEAVLYCMSDQVTERVDIQSVYSTTDVRDKLRESAECSLFLAARGADYSFSVKAWDDLQEITRYSSAMPAFYDAGETVYLAIPTHQGNRIVYEIYNLETEDTVITGFENVNDDAFVVLGVHDGGLCYMVDEHTDDGFVYGDLYICRNGESQKLAQDILRNGIRIYNDQVVEAITEMSFSDRVELEITLFENGEKTVLDDEISQVLRGDNAQYLFINDGDLYCYNGKEKSKLQTNVDWVWARNTMEYTEFSGDSEYFGFGY